LNLLLYPEIDAGADWYGKMIEQRKAFAIISASVRGGF
jgi:hypothetical protein